MNTLQTALCILEPQTAAHAPEMYEVLCDPAIYEYEGVPPPSLEKLENGLRRRESRVSPDGKEKWLNWAVRLQNGALTGYVQATVYESGAAYVGYEFSSRYWRQGIGSSSVARVLDDLRDTYAVHTFVAVLKTANFRSMGLLRKLGFTPGTEDDARVYEALPDETTLIRAANPPTISHQCGLTPRSTPDALRQPV